MVEKKIDSEGVRLPLNQAIGVVRIADEHGNHMPAPVQATYSENKLVEWMVTNKDLGQLMEQLLTKKEREGLNKKISEINEFIRESQYATREAKTAATAEPIKLAGFTIHKNIETFYSFKKRLESSIIIKVILKRGDFTLTPFMFVLLPFSLANVKIRNNNGRVKEGEKLGAGCFCTWKPNKKDVHEIVVGLSHASKEHGEALKAIIQNLR